VELLVHSSVPVNDPIGQRANTVHESLWVPAIGAQSIKFGLKGQVTYVETAEKGAIGKIAIGRLRKNSIRR